MRSGRACSISSAQAFARPGKSLACAWVKAVGHGSDEFELGGRRDDGAEVGPERQVPRHDRQFAGAGLRRVRHRPEREVDEQRRGTSRRERRSPHHQRGRSFRDSVTQTASLLRGLCDAIGRTTQSTTQGLLSV